MLKEMIRNNSPKEEDRKKTAVEKALAEFKNENGYDFLEMTNNPKTRIRHKLKQLQVRDYDDNDFLENFQDSQGD